MRQAIIIALLIGGITALGSAQDKKPAPPKTFEEALTVRWEGDLRRWESLARKIVAMAHDFPEDRMTFRFHPDTRSFIEEIWHETFDLQLLAGRLKGTYKELDTKRLFSGEGRPKDRAGAAREFEAVVSECAALLKKEPNPEVVASLGFYLEHGAVAYGKLVAMYRANGLVPPASRKPATPAVIPASAQSPSPQAPPSETPAPRKADLTTYEGYLLTVWRGLHNKILAMAKDLPEDKYGWKPHPASRSMLEEFRHVIVGLDMSSSELRGEKFDYAARVKALESLPPTRAAIVSEMERAIAASYPLVESSSKPRLVWWIDHQAEHYGKLVSNYRANGLVPPASRPRTTPSGADGTK